MADSDEWYVGEDGCLSVGKPTDGVTYHSTLNTILVATKEPAVKVLDVTSGLVLQSSDLSACRMGSVKCQYLAGRDKMFFTDGYAVGVRKDLNGILLLDTALQTPIERTEDLVSIDLSLPDATHLYKCLMGAELPGVDYVEDFLRELEKEIDAAQQATKGNHKIAKWATVCLRLPHCAVKTVCSNLVMELRRLHQHVPGLPIASAVTDRLSYLLPSASAEQNPATVDRSLMYSESARRLTFMKWPHMNYKWALPDAMAQAGFYHQPSSTGDDRAMCFTCNVCLVCWEPTDEPWSEHERHYPTCPFVKGEYTQNVPIAVSYATDPAMLHASKGLNDKVQIECVSSTSSEDFIATSSLHGNVVVWNTSRQLKKHIQFNIDPWEPVIAIKTGCQRWTQEDGGLTEKAATLSASRTLNRTPVDDGDTETDSTAVPAEDGISDQLPAKAGPATVASKEDSPSDDNKSKAEVIEVTGAWKQGTGTKVGLPVDDIETTLRDTLQRSRPSQDVLVSALCMVIPPTCTATEAIAGATAPASTTSGDPTVWPCLISGVAIRRNAVNLQGLGAGPRVPTEDSASEVQAMNQVNQALSGDSTPHIIPDSPSSSVSPASATLGQSSLAEKQNPFVPYLLVHDITKPRKGLQPWKGFEKNDKHSCAVSSASSSSSSSSSSGQGHSPAMLAYTGTKVSPVVPKQQDFCPIMESEEEDPDVQIVGVTMPLTDTMIKYNGAPSLVPAKVNNNNNLSDSGHTTTIVAGNKSPFPGKEHSSVVSVDPLNHYPLRKDGRIIQCLELPSQVTSDQYISSITPTLDNFHLVVVTAAKCLHQSISSVDSASLANILSPNVMSTDNGRTSPDSMDCNDLPPTVTDASVTMSEQQQQEQQQFASQDVTGKAVGGCLMVYATVDPVYGMGLLQQSPRYTYTIDNIGDTITSVLMMPKEICQSLEEEDMSINASNGDMTDWAAAQEDHVAGQIVVTTHKGDIKIIRLADCKTLATIPAPHRDKFVSVTYCTGMDRLCACTKEGKLHFFIVNPSGGHTQEDAESVVQAQMSPVRSNGGVGSRDEPMETNIDPLTRTEDLLVLQPLTTEVLLLLHELTQFESLMPRFSATVPPCWTEIQQEQQQRRHPQHLQQQGENMQHTRTWRLQPDSTSYDEHLLELVLPRTCSVGHIDLKFQLHPMCTTPPNIQVTLLKQNISNIGRQTDEQPSSGPVDVDARIDFLQETDQCDSMHFPVAASASSTTPNVSPQPQPPQMSVINNVLDPGFLKRYSAEILCGPVDLVSHIDLSGHCGVVSLTSPQLIKIKSRSFLVHIKALPSHRDEDEHCKPSNNRKNTPSNGASAASTSTAGASSMPTTSTGLPLDKSKDKAGLKCLLSASSVGSKPKLENVVGCDWLQEVSITVRRSKRTLIPRDRAQRLAIVENVQFQEQLLVAACGHTDQLCASTSNEYRQGLALDVLAWIAALQMNDPTHRISQSCIVLTVQSNLQGIIKACFIEAGRSIAHKCAKFITLCIEFSKNNPDPNLAPAFSFTLLHALLETMPLLPSVQSAGALHWYFTLLNRVKCMDSVISGQKCSKMLGLVARNYYERTNPLHSLLKARYGLYGAPLDAVLFDVSPPQFAKHGGSASTASSTASLCSGASAVGTNNNNAALAAAGSAGLTGGTGGNSSSNGGGGASLGLCGDEVDLRDLLSINSMDKSSKTAMSHIQHHLSGLLEVEPLHFVCHATSDGTRMERMDAGNNGPSMASSSTGLSGTINFGEAIPSVSAAGAALATLSTAMASAEQQLQLLQQKQLHLSKLQQQKQKLEQKLVENKMMQVGGSGASGGSGNSSSGQPSTSSGLGTSGFVPHPSELLPPTPKTTPLFNTPPVTPPNESYLHLYNQLQEATDPGKPPVWKPMAPHSTPNKGMCSKSEGNQQKLPVPQTQHLLQAPPPQVLVIERMPSGARRFVVLDFGKPVLLTDVIVPACGDLASLSIDTWVQGEELDGTRLVVSTDIGIRSLIMNDLMPPPVCRYLKITTVGRYSGGTTRSRIPIGSFYGHTTILPWECDVNLSGMSGLGTDMAGVALDQSQMLSQLGMFVSLQEDIQCRYSLACNRLTNLLSAIDVSHSNNSHTKYYLKNARKTEEDIKIHQAYQDCVQLQLQLNLAQRAIERLQRALGIHNQAGGAAMASPGTEQPSAPPHVHTVQELLREAPTDKLRCLAEQLLDTLLSMSCPSPTIPQLPASLHATFTPLVAESLFRHLCVSGTRRMQLHAGVLLVRLCGNQSWWGDFLGNVLQDYFTSEQSEVFPQDRVFLLATALGQKSLSGSSASDVLESILTLLAKLLSPLLANSSQGHAGNAASLDLCLIGWLLLFLSRNLDNTSISTNLGDDEKNKDTPGSVSSRWDFIQGESSIQNSRLSSRTSSSKLYRRKLQKRLMHHKQQLMDIQAAKKSFISTQVDKSAFSLTKEVEALMKQQEQFFKKQLKQYSSKHFKDIMQIRRTDGELLKKLPKDSSGGGGGSSGGQETGDSDGDTHVVVVREKCIPVVRGLIALLLSMDFTCNVDLFLITCKVVARLTNITRPAVVLSEVMRQEELERLMLLCCHLEYNHGNISWGGAWAAHAITCLLQDILDGERLYPANQSYNEGVTDDDMTTSMETDSSLPSSTSASSTDTYQPSVVESQGMETMAASKKEDSFKLDKDSSLIVDMILDDVEYDDDDTNAKLQEYIMGEVVMKPAASMPPPPPPEKLYQMVSSNMGTSGLKGACTINLRAPSGWVLKDLSLPGGSQQVVALKHAVKSGFVPPPLLAFKGPAPEQWETISGSLEHEDKKTKFELWKNKLASLVTNKATVVPQGISTAMDARLENSLELTAELRLKVMVSLETESVQTAISAPLPAPVSSQPHSFMPVPPTGNGEQMTDAGISVPMGNTQPLASHEMLSICFNNLFAQLLVHRVNIDALLLAYLTLNDETGGDDNAQSAFCPSKTPSIQLSPQSVTSLLSALAWAPNVPVRTWVLAFQVLTLLANLKCPGNSTSGTPMASTSSAPPPPLHNTGDKWLATVMVADSNMMAVLIKFLSGTSAHGPVLSSNQHTQVGPTAVRALQELLSRLQLRCAEENKQHLKELMLKLVYTLAAERGAFHSGLGPLDAQCKLLEHMLDQTYDHVDVSNAISVIDSLSLLVHQHLVGQERVICRSNAENGVGAHSCFCGLFAGVLRATNDSRTVVGEATRDILMCHLLKLVNMLIQIPLSGRSSSSSSNGGNCSAGSGASSSVHHQHHNRSNFSVFSDLQPADLAAAMDQFSEDSPMTDASKLHQSLTGGATATSSYSSSSSSSSSSSCSNRMTSPSEVPRSDDEKGGETDEQKSETASSAGTGAGSMKKARSCSHFSDVQQPGGDCKEATLSDVVLSHPQIMCHLLQALSCCNSNTMAIILSSGGLQGSLQEAFAGIDPLSVGDGVFQILCTLNRRATEVRLVLKPLLDYLGSGFCGIQQAGISRLSEPLLWFVLTVNDCEWAIRTFLSMGGVDIICANLVTSNRHVINVSPSLVSTIMQYLSNGKAAVNLAKRVTETDSGEGLQNFAPLGTISSTSPTAGPADVLLQASPPHRRARSAAWSYHFYPDEAWVDLTISLPCAIQLKEIHIQPHLTSLATCPAAVSVEVSREGSMMMPVCAPKMTSGLTFIKIHLLKPEVVTAVTVRLHKPRDSTTIGLSQIMLLGCTAFGDTGSLRASNVYLPNEDYVSRTSIGWLRLLHHCLTQCEAVSDEVAAAAARTPNLLLTCTALLVSSSANLYASSVEAVLLKIGLHSTEMGLALIANLLRNSSFSQQSGATIPLHGKVSGIANESTIDLLYQLGMTQDSGTATRIRALLQWLEDSAQHALQRARSAHQDSGYNSFPRRHMTPDLPAPAPAHVYCIAAILWSSQENSVTYNIRQLVSEHLLSVLYNWSTMLSVDSSLKKAIDTIICSLCYIEPQLFSTLLEWLGVPSSLDLTTTTNLTMTMAMTDDHKDSTQQHYRHMPPTAAATHNRESMTDDSKEANNQAMGESGPTTTELFSSTSSSASSTTSASSLELNRVCLDEPRLMTLALACQSPRALQMLLASGLPLVLCQGLFEFCTREMIHLNSATSGTALDGLTDACKSAGMGVSSGQTSESSSLGTSPPHFQHVDPTSATANRARSSSDPTTQSDGWLCITSDLVAAVLKFLAEVSKECVMKEWLGSAEGSVFWPALLHLLCNTAAQTTPSPPASHSINNHKHKVMTSQQRAAIETATVNFFINVISCHSENQHLFANVLCDVIRGQGSASHGLTYSSCALSGFTRRLFLQVLLEDEKVLVSLHSSTQLCKGAGSSLATLIQHPRCGAGHKHSAMNVSLHSTCDDVLSKISDTPSFPGQLLEDKTAERKASDDKKDTSELGLEVVDQISAAAGLQAKEKREKKAQILPRPPSRRGHRPPDLSGPLHVLSLYLYHSMLPGQPLPSDLTLSQLLVLLTERGLHSGQAMLDFSMKLRTKKVSTKGDKRLKTDDECLLEGDEPDVEVIPDQVLMDTPNFPSALQVFASVGGLALLAEHLPLLYPEVTRQVSPPSTTISGDNSNLASTGGGSAGGGGGGGLGNDWVTVESTEDIYEEIYEPMPASQPSAPGKQASQTLPTIPPHSLVAFGLFLRLPGYAEVLLKERKRAQCLLRLVLGVTDDGEGGHILTSPIASALPTLPFHVLKSLFDSTPLTTDDGVLLRRMALEIGAVHLVLACLSVLSHHVPRAPIPGFHQEVRTKIILAATQAASSLGSATASKVGEDKGHSYWAKGTGFGTGSTTSSWDAEQAFIRQRSEEEHVTCLLQVLSSYVNPGGQLHEEGMSVVDTTMNAAEENLRFDENNSLPAVLPELLSQSCLVPAISSYLRNDSVLDMARHVPLYRGLLELLRAMASCHLLIPLLLPLSGDDESASSVGHLLDKMKTCVDTYASRLKYGTDEKSASCGRTNKGKNCGGVTSKNKQEEEETEGLALLIPDIQRTAGIVHAATSRMRERHSVDTVDTADFESQGAAKSDHSQEERYIGVMRPLQFDTYEMVAEEESGLRFTLTHHYESNVKAAGDVNHAARARRLAQEAVTLSTSLPLSHSSSVFVRCDEDRLDIMKVLITGPSDTPYANGCFEFDVYFPQDYPNSPPLINLETTGNHTVRFNPNLYNDGKVCLSVLNTWHGRPEEKWNPQTSSFLQVLVSIQSLILVSEPYFNEPGYERSRGTPSGTASSREYDANIRQATVKWAMLEQLRNPSPCFRDVIERHFWLKRHEVMTQVEEWISELEVGSSDKRTGRAISHSCVALKRHYNQLKDELLKMKAPDGVVVEDDDDENTDASHSLGTETMDTRPQSHSSLDTDAIKMIPLKPTTSADEVTEKHTESSASQSASASKDASPSSVGPSGPQAGPSSGPASGGPGVGLMLMNHMDAVEAMANEIMDPSLMNSMLFDSSANNSLTSEIDDEMVELPLYHL